MSTNHQVDLEVRWATTPRDITTTLKVFIFVLFDTEVFIKHFLSFIAKIVFSQTKIQMWYLNSIQITIRIWCITALANHVCRIIDRLPNVSRL